MYVVNEKAFFSSELQKGEAAQPMVKVQGPEMHSHPPPAGYLISDKK